MSKVGESGDDDGVLVPRPDPPRELMPADDEDEDFIDETLSERLWGLTEMFPEGVRNGSSKVIDLTQKTVSTVWNYGRKGLWVLTSSAVILALPVMFETERVQMEEAQIQQQRQILLGPNAAVSGGGASPGLVPGAMPPLPQISPPTK